MTIRFLQTVASSVPDYPFMAGQVIRVDDPRPFLAYLERGYAVAVKDETPEFAVVRAPVVSARKGRRRGRL